MKKHFALIAVVLAIPLLQGDIGSEGLGINVGYKVAFVSERDGNPEIYIMNSDGTGPTRRTKTTVRDWSPAFSPDVTTMEKLWIARVYTCFGKHDRFLCLLSLQIFSTAEIRCALRDLKTDRPWPSGSYAV